MSLIDAITEFGAAVAANSTFAVIDLGLDGRDLSANRHGAGYLNVHLNGDASAESVITLKQGDSASSVSESTGVTITIPSSAKAGAQFSVRLPRSLKRFVTITGSADAGATIDAFIGAPLADH